jgi:hypothetical protein
MYNYSERFAHSIEEEKPEKSFKYSFIKVFRNPFDFTRNKFHVLDFKGDITKFDEWDGLFGNCNQVIIIKKEIKNERPEKRTRREAS